MKTLRMVPLFALLLSMCFSVFLFAEEAEDNKNDTPMYGDPECRVCKGTGILTPQSGRKSKRKAKQYVMYCYHKAKGKRCNIMIGGWEPCESCSDMPSMVGLINEHSGIVGALEENSSKFEKLEEGGFKLNYLEGVHYCLGTNISHSSTHGVIDAVETAWDLFALEWGLLPLEYVTKQSCYGEEIEEDDDGKYTDGYNWDGACRNPPEAIYLFNDNAQFQKFIDWYWDHAGGRGNHGMGGKELLKKCASIGVSGNLPRGRATYWRGDLEVHCSLIHGAAHQYLKQNGGSDLPHWLNEGFAKYMEYRVKGTTLTHCIEYGSGKRNDTDWQSSSNWKEMLKKAAGQESMFNDATNKWVGLIPMNYMMEYKITNIPWQGLAQSWGLVCYLMGEGQKANIKAKYIEKFKKLVGRISVEGKDAEKQEAVFQEVYGMSSEEMFKKWKVWLIRNF